MKRIRTVYDNRNGKKYLAYRVNSEEFYAIELKDTGKVIGNIYCRKRDYAAREVGYIINKKYQRRGYASEALYAECDPRNTGSLKLIEKVGMTREAFLHKNIYFHKDLEGYLYLCSIK